MGTYQKYNSKVCAYYLKSDKSDETAVDFTSCVCTTVSVWNLNKNKSDISYIKTSRAFNVPIHSRALLAAILCCFSDSVDIMSSCSFLVSQLSVSLTSISTSLPQTVGTMLETYLHHEHLVHVHYFPAVRSLL